MAFIVEHIIGDRGIQIGYEDVIRPLSFGTNWTRLRVGVRYAVYGTSAINVPDVRLGFCVGNNGGISNSTTSAIWMKSEGTAGAHIVSGTPPNVYYDSGAAYNLQFYERVNNTTTPAGAFAASRSGFSANPTALRSILMFDVAKVAGSSSITFNFYYLTAAQVVTDWTRSAFLTAMANDGTPAGTTNVTSSYTPTRTQRDWDSAFIGWARSTPAMCVYDMGVARYT